MYSRRGPMRFFPIVQLLKTSPLMRNGLKMTLKLSVIWYHLCQMNYRGSMRSYLMIRILQLTLRQCMGNTLGRWNWTTKELMSCKLRERAQVHKHGLQMINLLEKLQNLEHSVDLILLSLLSSYEGSQWTSTWIR